MAVSYPSMHLYQKKYIRINEQPVSLLSTLPLFFLLDELSYQEGSFINLFSSIG